MKIWASRFAATLLLAFIITVSPAPARADLFVSSSFNDSVKEYNGTTGAFVKDFVPTGVGGLDRPEGLVFGPNSNLFVSSYLTSSVLEYNGTTGAFVRAFVPTGSGGLGDNTGLVFGPNGNLFVSSLIHTGVKEYNGTSGAFVTDFVPTGSGGLAGPLGLVFGPNGNLFVSSFAESGGFPFANSVLEYNGTTGAFVTAFVPPLSGGLAGPTYLAFSPGGPVSTVPEPASLFLFGSGLAGLAGFAWRRHRRK